MAELKEEQKTIIRGTFWGLLGNVAIKFVSFFYLILLARFFTTDEVGIFYLCFSITTIIFVFADLGLTSTLSRYIPFYCSRGEKDRAYGLLKVSYLVAGFASVFFAAVLFILSDPIAVLFRNPAIKVPLQIISTVLVARILFVMNVAFIEARKNNKVTNFLLNAQNIIKLALTIALLWFMSSSSATIIAAFVGSYLLATIISFWSAKREIDRLGLTQASLDTPTSFKLLAEVVPFGLMLSFLGAIWMVMEATDRLMMGYMLPPEIAAKKIAVYSVALALASLIMIFPAAVCSIFLPMVTEFYGKGKKDEMVKLASMSFRWLVMLMAPLTILLIAFPDKILQLFYGAEYATGAWVLAIFSVGLFIRGMSYVQNYMLVGARIVKIELTIAIATAMLNVILCWFLITLFGMEGAALASALSFCFITILMTYYSKKLFGFGVPGDVYKILLAMAAGLLVLFALRGVAFSAIDSLTITVPGLEGILLTIFQKLVKLFALGVLFLLSTGVFFIALAALKAFREEDAAVVSSGLKRLMLPEQAVLLAERLMEMGMA